MARTSSTYDNFDLYLTHMTLNFKLPEKMEKGEFFMPPKELRWHIKIEPSVRLSVLPSVTNRVSAISHKLLKQI